MAREGAKTATPRLRFPEFKNARPWNTKLLEDLCAVNPSNSGLPDSFVYIDLESVEDGQLKSKNRIEKIAAPSRAQRLLRNGDVIFQVVRPYQRNNLFIDFDDGQTYVASTGYAQLRAKDSERFLYQAVHVDSFVEGVIAKCTGSNYPAINSSDLAGVRLFAPDDVAEQQKIADCLTSLDEVIAAQGRKVDALKAHKRGLMQQLFPREGETRPRLRFPEFRDAPEWAEKTLGETASVQMCKRIFASETNTIGGVPFYKIGTLGGVPDAYILKELFNEYRSKYNFPRLGEILITCSGTVGKCLRYDGRDSYFQDSNIVWIDNPTGTISNDFLFELISNVDWGKLNSTTITRIYGPDLRGLSIKYPKDAAEQQRIAGCLSSLDTQITAESNRLAALKTHKQGLMQQLFPAPDAAAA